MSSTTSRQSIKHTVPGISGRRKRKENMVSIRKARKEDGYAARRNMAAAAKADKASARSEVMKTLGVRAQALLVGISKEDEPSQMKSLKAFVLLMSSGVPPLFDDGDPQHLPLWSTIMSALPTFIKFLNSEKCNNMMKSDAAFALRFISSMDRSAAVIQAGALPCLMHLLQSGISELQMQAAWCLGNIASESVECCTLVLDYCTPAHVLPYIRMATPALRRSAVWLLRSLLDHKDVLLLKNAMNDAMVQEITTVLCQIINELTNDLTMNQSAALIAPWRMFEMKTGKPAPNDIAVVRFMATIDAETIKVSDLDVNFLTGQNDIYTAKLQDLVPLETIDDDMDEEELQESLNEKDLTICDSCWGLVEIATDPAIQTMVQMNMCTTLVRILRFYSSAILCSPALRLFEYIVSAADDNVAIGINAGMVQMMPQMLFNQSKSVREECCWLMSNIAAGNPVQVQAILEEPHLMIRLAEQLAWAEWDVRREAAWVICNITVRAPEKYLTDILKLGVLDSFSILLGEQDPQVSLLVLEAITAVLRIDPNLYKTQIEEAGCIDKIEELCYDENDQLCTAATTLMDTYFQDQDQQVAAQGVVIDQNTSQAVFSFQPTLNNETFNFKQ